MRARDYCARRSWRWRKRDSVVGGIGRQGEQLSSVVDIGNLPGETGRVLIYGGFLRSYLYRLCHLWLSLGVSSSTTRGVIGNRGKFIRPGKFTHLGRLVMAFPDNQTRNLVVYNLDYVTKFTQRCSLISRRSWSGNWEVCAIRVHTMTRAFTG